MACLHALIEVCVGVLLEGILAALDQILESMAIEPRG